MKVKNHEILQEIKTKSSLSPFYHREDIEESKSSIIEKILKKVRENEQSTPLMSKVRMEGKFKAMNKLKKG